MITDEQIKEAFYEMYQYEQEIISHNAQFVKLCGDTAEKDFEKMCEDCRVTSKIEFVEGARGRNQDESYGVFKNVHIDQYSVGDSGDSYAGTIYANVGDKWISVRYEC